MRTEKITLLATLLLAACACIVTGLLVVKELRRSTVRVEGDRRVASYSQYATGLKTEGRVDAPVTIVLFSDFQCPYCGRLREVLDRVLRKNSHVVRLVFRHMPLERLHPQARLAALGAECAARQGHFRTFHDKLFDLQDSLAFLSMRGIAGDINGVDTDRFDECMAGDAARQALTADSSAAAELMVRGTPTMLINDLMISGVIDDDSLQFLISGFLADTPKAGRQ